MARVARAEMRKVIQRSYHPLDGFFWPGCSRQGDEVKGRRHLDLALEADPGEIDALIACYRLPDPTPEYRKQILDLINQAAAKLRAQIAKSPNQSTPYNQFAWLIANTEGDYDRAIEYSKRSLILRPERNGGYYDTLARCYFAKGDYENALKYQTKAAELEPHSGLIARQLELFRKTPNRHKEKKTQPADKQPQRKQPAQADRGKQKDAS